MILTHNPKTYLNNLNLSFPAASYSGRRISFRRTEAPVPPLFRGIFPGAPLPQSSLLKEGKEQTLIVDKSLISFVSDVSAYNRADILESTLLAQLGARAKVPDESDAISWYKAYMNILSKIGWVVEGGEVEHFSSKGNIVELQSVIVDILTNAFGAGFVKIVTRALAAIKSLESTNGKIEAFERNTHIGRSGSFQVGIASEEGGAVSINLGTFLITSINEIKHILFIKFRKDETDLQYASSRLTLDQEIYSDVRNLVRKKLSGRATEFVSEILV